MVALDLASKRAFLSLTIPVVYLKGEILIRAYHAQRCYKCTYPSHRTQGLVGSLEVLARLVVLALCLGALVEIDIILPAVPRLVCVGETSIKLGCLHLDLSLCHLQRRRVVKR